MSEIKEYRITREACQANIDKAGYVCAGCGGPIIPFDTVDNSGAPTFWSGCESCSCFGSGVPPNVFQIAAHMVDKDRYHYYSFNERPREENTEEFAYWRTSQIRGLAGDVWRILRLNEEIARGEA